MSPDQKHRPGRHRHQRSHMHRKNNVIINNKPHIKENCLMLAREMLDTDESRLLQLCFGNITEYDPDVVFDKNADVVICSIFFYVLSFDQKLFFCLFKRRPSVIYFDVLHVYIFIQQKILGKLKFSEKS